MWLDLTKRPGAGTVWGSDPGFVFCSRVVKSTCVAPRVTCWRKTGAAAVWTSTMSRTMQTVAAPQLLGDGVGWLLVWVIRNRDYLGCHGKVWWEGKKPEPV